MIRIFYLLLILFCAPMNAQVFDYLVSKDDDGAYRTIQSLIGRLPDNSSSRIKVFIKNGVYEEKLNLPSSKTNISFIGESVDSVIITWNDYAGKDGISAANSYTFLVEGADFYMENITVQNTAGNVGQAIAIRTTGERQVFKNCKFLGFQDTYYAHKNRQYNFNCYVEGATDFIYGDATTVFDSCIIHCLKGGQYVTAPSDTKLTSTWPRGTFYHGLLFRYCTVERDNDVNNDSYYLGRPWQANSSSVYIQCSLDEHIKPEGWAIWSGTDNHETSFFAEFENKDMNGLLVDTLNRVNWSYQLTAEEVETYYSLQYFLEKEDVEWDPKPITQALPVPQNLTGENTNLTWEEVTDAIGYVIIRNDSVIGFSETNSYSDETANLSISNSYKVKSITENGNLSDESNSYLLEAITSAKQINIHQGPEAVLTNNILYLSELCDIQIYSTSGSCILSRRKIDNLDLRYLTNGIYILVITDQEMNLSSQKILINR